jgi:hypothetical protein
LNAGVLQIFRNGFCYRRDATGVRAVVVQGSVIGKFIHRHSRAFAGSVVHNLLQIESPAKLRNRHGHNGQQRKSDRELNELRTAAVTQKSRYNRTDQ